MWSCLHELTSSRQRGKDMEFDPEPDQDPSSRAGGILAGWLGGGWFVLPAARAAKTSLVVVPPLDPNLPAARAARTEARYARNGMSTFQPRVAAETIIFMVLSIAFSLPAAGAAETSSVHWPKFTSSLPAAGAAETRMRLQNNDHCQPSSRARGKDPGAFLFLPPHLPSSRTRQRTGTSFATACANSFQPRAAKDHSCLEQ
jgi:hypothetical protein